MKVALFRHVVSAAWLLLALGLTSLWADDAPPPADAPPKGEVTQYKFADSKIYPGTVRDYWVYVPKQYDPAKPACLYVNLDGIQYNAPVVFDQLIHSHEMPVTIGVFVKWGLLSAIKPGAGDRFNRAVEFDTADGRFAQFLIDELLPVVEQQSAGGRLIRLSRDPNDRCIAGASSGAACAFTAAWERPDSFHRVFSTIGTYVGLRGADCYPTMIRKTEPKPLRVFLQEGSTDQNIFAGDWWMANQMMERALTFAGYEVNHVWGEGGHNTDQGTAIFPDAMRWLWKDWPAPIKTGAGSPEMQTVLLPGETWKLVVDGLKQAGAPAANPQGEVVFADAETGQKYRIDRDGTLVVLTSDEIPGITGQAFRGDGRLCSVGEGIEGISGSRGGSPAAMIESTIRGRDLVVCHDGSMYVTQPAEGGAAKSQVWYVSPKGEKKALDTGLKYPTGIALSCDQSLLFVAEGHSHWIYSFQIGPDGSLLNGQRYHFLHMPEAADTASPGGMASDRLARLYVATNLGVQICDQTGRVYHILPLPSGKPSHLCFGGENFDTLFVTCGDAVYQRKLKVQGAPAFQDPVAPPKPRL